MRGGAAAPHGAVAHQPARRGRAGGGQPHPPAGGARAAAGAGPVRGRPLPGGRRLRRHRRHAHRQQERPRADAVACRRARRPTRRPATAGMRARPSPAPGSTSLRGAAAARERWRRWSDSPEWASPRWCCGCCPPRASRSASWCARRKAGTRPRRRGCFELPRRRARSSTPPGCATSPRQSQRSMRARSASPRWSASRPAAASPTAATCASRAVRCAPPPRAAPGIARRYESYRRLRRLREELSAARGPARRR